MQLYKDIFDLIAKHPDDPSIYTAMIPFKSQVNTTSKSLATRYIFEENEVPLDRALQFSGKNVLIALLKHGAHTKKFDTIKKAIYRKGSIKILADYGFDLTIKDDFNEYNLLNCVLHYSNVDPNQIKELVDYGVDVNFISEGKTPLHVLVSQDCNPEMDPASRIESIKILLQKGADPNIQACSQYPIARNIGTPLHWSAHSDQPQPRIVEMLLEYGAEVNAKLITPEGILYKPIDVFSREHPRPHTKEVSQCITLLEQAERWRENKLRTTWVTAAVVTGRKLHQPINPTPLNTCTAIIPYTGRSEIIE